MTSVISQERVLEIIRAHPDGITSVRIAEIIGGPRSCITYTVRNKVNQKCRALERYGLVVHEVGHRDGNKGPRNINAWRAVHE